MAWRDGVDIELSHKCGVSHVPSNIDTFADLLTKHPDATIVAGATDVGLWVTKEMRPIFTCDSYREN
jgi:xanthine dehydrogenase small subunit